MNGFPTINIPAGIGTSEGFSAFDDLTPEQQTAAAEMIRDAQVRDLYNALAGAAKAVNSIGSLIGGIESDDLLLDHNPATGRTQIMVNRQLVLDAIAGSNLPAIAWADRFKVLSVVVVDEGDQTVAWDKDYVRSVAATEA